MKICAIISEYNPFHGGHLLQIQEIRRQIPDIRIVSILSGNYVQRGEPALWDKYFRAAGNSGFFKKGLAKRMKLC